MADSWLQRMFCGFDRNGIKSSCLILIITFLPCDHLPSTQDLVAPSKERVLANQVGKWIVVNCEWADLKVIELPKL